MGRYRSRSRSRSYSPVHRKRYDGPSDRNRSYRDRRSPGPSGLLVRNISLDSRPEDLRIPFERFGPLKDVYLPKNYYTGEPRGFGFVKFRHAEDAAEAKEQLNHTVIGGREIRIVFAEENRKTPKEMRKVSHVSSRGSYRRRSPSRSPRRRYHSHSRSPSPARDGSRDHRTRGGHYSSRQQSRSRSRSMSPRSERDHKSSRRPRSISRSPSFHDEQRYKSNRRPSIERESGQSPYDEKYVRGRSASPRRKTRSRSRSRSPSFSPR